MQDVARLAGVCTATVSAVINDKGCVSPTRTERVRKAMEALDYRPDQVARGLRVGRTKLIGLIVPDVTNPFYTEIMRGVEEVAERDGYFVILCDSNRDCAREKKYLMRLRSQRVDGVLMAGSGFDAAYDELTPRPFPMVFVDHVPKGVKDGVVAVDNLGGAYKATRYLISLGHQRIAIIAGNLARSVAVDRLEGFRIAMGEANLPVPDAYLQRGDFLMESGYRAGRELMQLALPPTAVFACNNRMTLGLMRALAELEVPCPGRVSVVCYDEADWATSFRPSVTCVAQPSYDLGRLGTEMLLRRIKPVGEAIADSPEQGSVSLQTELCLRESCAPPPNESLPDLKSVNAVVQEP
jgi:LacI family transcriptional regulator